MYIMLNHDCASGVIYYEISLNILVFTVNKTMHQMSSMRILKFKEIRKLSALVKYLIHQKYSKNSLVPFTLFVQAPTAPLRQNNYEQAVREAATTYPSHAS